ncbi:MAG TPA: hypothetical protein VEL47_02750 [Myxococcota bacterium]|nr:hypothetical protein [Myxococcota bacterium]
MAKTNDYHIACEPDVSGKVNRHIWAYFLLFALLLFLTIVGLTIMYRFQVQYQRERKIGDINTQESMNQVALSQAYLSGKKGLFEGKRYVAIDIAMDQLIQDVRRAK